MISVIYYILLMTFLVVWGVAITIVWAITVPFDKKRKILSYTTFIHATGLFIFAPRWKIKIEGKENLVKGKSYVIISNHQDLYDIPLLHYLKFNVRWVSKRELLKMPFVGHALLIHDDILLERGDASSAKHMLDKGTKTLKNGVSVTIFPEGTRSKTCRVNRFREGAFIMAKQADVEILPIVLEGTGTSRTGWKLNTPHTFHVKVLPAIDIETVRNNDAKALATMAHDMIISEHKKIRADLYNTQQ